MINKNKIIIEKVSIEDIDEIYEIDKKELKEHWNKSIYNNEVLLEKTIYIKIVYGTCIIGFAGAKYCLEEAEITKIIIKKEYQNNGFGTILLNNLINELKKRNTSLLFLEVRESNQQAINFYLKHGFFRVDLRKGYYKDESAIIMRLDL